MVTIKSYTSLEQSRKLAEILPIESADMYYGYIKDKAYFLPYSDTEVKALCTPCWSLASLLSIIPKRIKVFIVLRIDINKEDFSIWYDEVGCGVNTKLPDITMECPVDACVAMIEKLHELNLL